MISHYYWNTNGMAVAIVAVVSPSGLDWAVYIGATPSDTHYVGLDGQLYSVETSEKRYTSEEETVEWAARYGAKLSEEMARFLFAYVKELKALPYRP